MNKWSVIKTWPTSPAQYVAGGLRYTEAATGEWVEVHPDAKVGDSAMVGDYAKVGDCAKVGDYATVGNSARVGDYAKVEKTPLYLWPHGGQWPVCVADPDKRLIAIGCEIHNADFWLNGGADKVREKHGTQDTKATYDAAIKFVCEQMGWLTAASEGAKA
jgi:carbonic anhydrase/acetyltransferase-like protein (isoleucine patch superfamily)